MSHFAQIDENNVVVQVLVGNNNDPKGDEGESWFVENLGGRWVKTSWNNSIRKNYAGIGFTYDEERDAFIPPKPFASWILNEETCQWEAPVQQPLDSFSYFWNEDNLNWELADFSQPNTELEA
jgi:hypothetical protein